ncbi:DUF1685 domain-containing protein [Pseudomonas syringae pv. theae]|nr:DUF1685 domain-containing protein [Pseudomonas syringae pv. theae]
MCRTLPATGLYAAVHRRGKGKRPQRRYLGA